MFLLMTFNFIIFMIMSLISVAFITLLERKILGYMQIRLGPNKVGPKGILQPFSDAVKLYSKEITWPSLVNTLPYFMSPCLSLILSLTIWLSLPYFTNILSMNLTLMLFLSILGLGVYPILISGWSSNSNYSMIGSMRALAQTISYEVSLMFIIMSICLISCSMNLYNICVIQKFFIFAFLQINFLMWLISILAETNRTPFDFSEGESELVSGFNTEYSSSPFAIIFMAEYMMILFFSMLTSIIFLGISIFSPLNMLNCMMLMFFFLWTRVTLPRYRYDKLMLLCWKKILPLSLIILIPSICISIMFM
uniref:NADH-ubiquinone oxidoreductase chain 1 n=1 Tax=Dendrothrips minowai TaxID=1030662 RepID=A0A343WRN9_9NEOP|nr:NADH dehydrogenase subunit 1 [Dendrothrips minowai]AWD37108.1 NADH dehydrogenase subunit 1 [Dendrothrips minowai]